MANIQTIIANKNANVLFDTFFNTNSPFVFFKIPNDNSFHFLADEHIQNITDTEVLFSKKGFVFSPFRITNESKQIFIENKIHYQFSCLNFDCPTHIYTEKKFNKCTLISKNNKEIPTNNQLKYTQKVEKGLEQIKNGIVKKVVLAHEIILEIVSEIDYIKLFKETFEMYEDAFVSLTYIPKKGVWLGASPELLISVDKNNIFKTVALAGTKVVKTGDAACDAQWSQKEIQEQALVERYIVDCFKKIRLREYEEDGPKTVRAGSLWHLKSTFSVNLLEQKFEQLPQVMLDLLHPTSAVCGTPKEIAIEIIDSIEGFDRAYYAGFLGPINLFLNFDYETHIFVNIRCTKLMESYANLYVGAGITNDSVPENEEKEIAIKSQIMLKVLNNILT